MDLKKTALILIGYQNDYFADDGILHGVIEESSRVSGVLANTLEILDSVLSSEALLITTPIIFTPEYSELKDPVGILKTIKEVGAFKGGTSGAETIKEFDKYKDRIIEVPGKRGLNAFSNTELSSVLEKHGVENVVLAGAVTSICIDSTGRAAFEQGYRVTQLSDCTTGRSLIEQDFYCQNIFPLYAEVLNHTEFLARVL